MPNHPESFDSESTPALPEVPDELAGARAEFATRTINHWQRHIIENASPKNWPLYPLLCIVHRRDCGGNGSPFKQPGLIHASDPTSVAAINIYDLPAYGGKVTEEELEQCMISYSSIDELLVDWKID